MPVLDPNEIFFTAFEPKQTNRFIMFIDGFPAYQIKGVSAINVTSCHTDLPLTFLSTLM